LNSLGARFCIAFLQGLYKEHHASASERMRALTARQQQLAVSEALAGQLGDIVALGQLQDPQPQDFPKPPQGSERWVGAQQNERTV